MILSKNKIQYFRSLSLKKNRDAEGVFIAEGSKLVLDLLPYFELKYLVADLNWYDQNAKELAQIIKSGTECYELSSSDDMKKLSLLTTPAPVFAVFAKRDNSDISISCLKNELILALDRVQDPGNLGTIVRIADWFGIKHIISAHGTADIYNPKVVQATMGALARVSVHYCDLQDVLESLREEGVEIFGTFLDGDTIYSADLPNNGVVVMGNEGSGISSDLEHLFTHRLLIPNFPTGVVTSESLNVAVATAIICSEFRRR
ncbi:MAG: RNA methyltransferase [bacterium]